MDRDIVAIAVDLNARTAIRCYRRLKDLAAVLQQIDTAFGARGVELIFTTIHLWR
ncbi:MAG: DUF2703 domain-containing protein [Pyrinomonadaceae bacterium]|nr:DUF2703 domain-containing protein [Pyrinomonadaceae bacterium]